MIVQALSPTFWGTLADSWGRRPILLSTVTIYCATCIGLALAPNYASVLVLRCLQAFGSSSLIAISAGILSDIVQARKYEYLSKQFFIFFYRNINLLT
jgi:MFS family permease